MSKIVGRGAEQVSLRLPNGMRDELKRFALENGRSLNAEIIHRLDLSVLASKSRKGDVLELENGDVYIRQEQALSELNIDSAILTIKYGLDALQNLVQISKQKSTLDSNADDKQ